jgi:peptidoglycan/LPS O-acetylase OafA/YrhL
VLISHSFGEIWNYNVGVVAVYIFFLLAGYATSKLYFNYYKNEYLKFYKDKCIRIFPNYLLILFIYVITLIIFDDKSFTVNEILMNIFILPSNFYMFFEENFTIDILGLTWSLGLELIFYIFFPVIMSFDKKTINLIFGSSILIHFIAFNGVINSDWFGYRLLPGVLFIFLGAADFAKTKDLTKVYLIMIYLFFLFFIQLINSDLRNLLYNKEMILGVFLGAVFLVFYKQPTYSKFDKFLGNLSYSIFLNHIPIIFLFKKLFQIQSFNYYETFILIVVSILIATLTSLYVEKFFYRYRVNLRKL